MKSLLLLVSAPLLIWSCMSEGTGTEESTANLASSIELSSDESSSAYPTKTGKISYALSGMMKGDETLYWADGGKKQRRETNTVVELMGIKQADAKVVVILEGKVYNLNEKKKTATVMSSEMGDAMAEMDYSSEEALEKFGGVKEGTGEVLGKTCQIWNMEAMMSKVWVWKGLALRSETKMGMINTEIVATAVELDAKLDDDLFDVSDYEIKDMGKVEDYFPKTDR